MADERSFINSIANALGLSDRITKISIEHDFGGDDVTKITVTEELGRTQSIDLEPITKSYRLELDNPRWVYGNASSNGQSVPTCSKCGRAVPFEDTQQKHESECWGNDD